MSEAFRQEYSSLVRAAVLEVLRSDLSAGERQCLKKAMGCTKFRGFSLETLYAKILCGLYKAGLVPADLPAEHQRKMVCAYFMSAWES